MRISLLFRILVVVSTLIILLYMYQNIQKPQTVVSTPDQCMSCHSNYGSLDTSHPIEVFGCAKCHGGNKFSTDKNSAHEGIVNNPSRLEHTDRFCAECHQDISHRVKMSLMESQNGILDVLKEQWGHKSVGLKSAQYGEELAENHFNKACASCHINQKEEIFNPKYAKGGGCAACHRVGEKQPDKHPSFSTQIPSQNCLKCHNRSNRIGTSYFGKFESEGYGTPYQQGDFSNKLDDTRFYYELPSDVHHEKAGLDCIDCHTEKGVMGDGRVNKHMEDAVDITCKDCHTPTFKEFLPKTLAETLLDLNKNIPKPKEIAYSGKKNAPIYNLQKNDNNISFYRKRDGQSFNMTKMSDNAYHSSAIHERLDCSACHAQWIASCYGCHEVYFKDGKQYDWTQRKMTEGAWMELRSFLRFESPSLGVGYNKKIMPFAPGCQIIGTVFEDKKVEQFHAFAMAGWEPHTTGKSRTCIDCHFDPASLGLGRGNLNLKKDGTISFSPFYDSQKSGLPIDYPIDAFVSAQGKQFQTTSRENARSFNNQEIKGIVNAYKCILCHRTYEDKIYQDFNQSKKLFKESKTSCSK